LAATSPGISREVARELSKWGPAHDSLYDDSDSAASINYHPLHDGVYCLSQTVSSGMEYSGRGSGRIYTQCFVIPEEVMLRFAGNPFRLLEAIVSAGHVVVFDDPPELLEPISLVGRAAVADLELLDSFVNDVGLETLTILVDALLSTDSLGLVGHESTKRLFTCLLNVLPVECRSEVSFSTGLKPSPCRPYRLITMNSPPTRARRTSGPVPLDLNEPVLPRGFPSHRWTELVHWLVAHDDLTRLRELLNTPRPGLEMGKLDCLGEKLYADVCG